MKPARSRLRRLVLVLIVLTSGLAGRLRGGEQPRAKEPAPAAGAAIDSAESGRGTLDLSAVASRDRAQIQRVVETMDRTGTPPQGVAQGGRLGGQKGVFQNREGRLPRKAPGYWTESDVWPKQGPRGAERLIFGRAGEVYWTRDHYETFVQLR
jgi:guanyl-specific ribonuclease Sa